MEALVRAAVAGTARQNSQGLATGAPLDDLVAGLPDATAEWRLLLQAGAWAAYRLAGWTAETAPTAIPAAPPEQLRVCSPGAARLIRELFPSTRESVLREALERLRRVGQVLAPELLPAALAARDAELRAALVPALGERGRWLASLNPAWRWVADALPEGEVPPTDAETLWQEGAPAQRCEVLRRQRRADPGRAREWLADAWRLEKAEFRAVALGTLEVGLSAEDEPFLEERLADRSAPVRAQAAALLARLPGSALAARMAKRAEALLALADGALIVTLPRVCEADWQRDGIVAKPPQGTPERSWWLQQLLSCVPPTHWERRFERPPYDLIAAAVQGEWAPAVIAGWSQAAVLHDNAAWIVVLWDWWFRYAASGTSRKAEQSAEIMLAAVLAEDLLAHMPAQEAEQFAMELLTDPEWGRAALHEVLLALPIPWSADLGMRFLRTLRAQVSAASSKRYPETHWRETIDHAALALPAECFAEALAPWDLPESETSVGHYWQSLLDEFGETLRLRQRLLEEIPA
jgi:hypothetical protein